MRGLLPRFVTPCYCSRFRRMTGRELLTLARTAKGSPFHSLISFGADDAEVFVGAAISPTSSASVWEVPHDRGDHETTFEPSDFSLFRTAEAMGCWVTRWAVVWTGVTVLPLIPPLPPPSLLLHSRCGAGKCISMSSSAVRPSRVVASFRSQDDHPNVFHVVYDVTRRGGARLVLSGCLVGVMCCPF